MMSIVPISDHFLPKNYYVSSTLSVLMDISRRTVQYYQLTYISIDVVLLAIDEH